MFLQWNTFPLSTRCTNYAHCRQEAPSGHIICRYPLPSGWVPHQSCSVPSLDSQLGRCKKSFELVKAQLPRTRWGSVGFPRPIHWLCARKAWVAAATAGQWYSERAELDMTDNGFVLMPRYASKSKSYLTLLRMSILFYLKIMSHLSICLFLRHRMVMCNLGGGCPVKSLK